MSKAPIRIQDEFSLSRILLDPRFLERDFRTVSDLRVSLAILETHIREAEVKEGYRRS